jgi:hypothetical protein
VLAALIPWPTERLATCIDAVLAGAILLAVAGSGSSYIRGQVMTRYAPWVARMTNRFT